MNPMMDPMSFTNDNGSGGIPMFSKNGTALSNAERQKIAHRRGVCIICFGTKTHEVKVLGRTPLTNQDVYQGICIRCNGGSVPSNVLNDWQTRNQPAAQRHGRLRTTVHALRVTGGSGGGVAAPAANSRQSSNFSGSMGSGSMGSGLIGSGSMGSGTILTAEVTPAIAAPRPSHQVGMTRTMTPPLGSMGSGTILTAEVSPVRVMSHDLRTDSERSSNSALGRADQRSQRMRVRSSSEEESVNRYSIFQHQLSGSSLPGHAGGEGGSGRQLTNSPGGARTPLTPSTPSSINGGIGIVSSGSSSSPHHPNGGGPPNAEPEDYITSMDTDSFLLVKELRTNRDNPDKLVSTLHGLRNLAEDEVGALSEIQEIIEMYFDNDTNTSRRLITVAIGSIWGICSKDDDKKKEAAEAGCLNLIFDSLRHFKDDPETVLWATGALSSLATIEDNKLWIACNGGIEMMVEALDIHQTNPSVLEWVIRALFVMITPREESTNSETQMQLERNMMTLQEANGIKLLTAAMKRQSENDSAVHYWAMKIALRLLDRTTDEAADEVIRQFAEANLAQVCISTLKGRSVTNDLFSVTSEVLTILLETNTFDSTSGAADCINSVMKFIGEKTSTGHIKGCGAKLLAVIARGNNQTKRQISENACVKMLVTNMINRLDDLKFLQSTMLLLCTLACDESSFDFSLLGDIKYAIEKIHERYPDDVQLNVCICDFVANNASIAQGQPDSVPVDVAMRICHTNFGVSARYAQIGRTVAIICTQFPEAARDFIQGDGVVRLLECLSDSNLDVQISSCVALSGIVSHSEEWLNQLLDESGLETATGSLLVAVSEVLARSVLELVSAIVTNTSRRALQLPSEIILGIVQGMEMFPKLKQVTCITIRNVMLVTVPGLNSINTDGLVQALSAILDDRSSSDEEVIEACGAIWAFCTKQPVPTNGVSQLLASLLGICSLHKGSETSPFNSAVLTAAAGALSGVMYCIQENPIHIPDNDIDLMISILDLAIEYDVGNVSLMNRMLDVILLLCLLGKEILIQCGVIVVVIDSMVEHEGNEEIQQKGCAILALLASTENLQVNLSIAETDGIDLIVSALAGFSENTQIQTDACRALSHLSIDYESRMLISSQGGLILLVNAMNKYRDETDLLEAACSALLNLSSDAEEQAVVGSNVIETVITTMTQQVLSPRLQEKSLGVLQNISMRSKDAKRAIADAGGIEAITFTIREFMGSPAVMERAFTTMWSLAVLEENQARIADLQGISLVVNGMMANITYEKVQKQACGCLCTLSTDSRNKTLIRDLGGVDSIVYAMWAHYNSDGLLIEACRALSSLAVNVQTNEVMIATDGEISAIMAAMRRFPASERLQEHACVALRNFMLSTDNVALVRNQQAELGELMNQAATRFPERCADRAGQVIQSIHG